MTTNKTGAELIADERQRQISQEDWSKENDARYTDGQLILAAIVYAANVHGDVGARLGANVDGLWPWDEAWFKPTVPLRDLAKAGALIAAEMDRRMNQQA